MDLVRKLSNREAFNADENLELRVENIIQTLSNCINLEFNKNSGSNDEELFCAPSLIDCDLTQRLQLARDLSDLLANAKSKRDSALTNQSVASLRNYRKSCIIPDTYELIEKIFDPGCENLSLTPSQSEEILMFIQNNSTSSETSKFRVPLSGYQRDLIMISQKIEKIKKNLRSNQDKRDALDINNRELRENIKLLQKKESNLNQQLDDSIEEKALAKMRRNSLQEEIKQTKELLEVINAKERSQGSVFVEFSNELSAESSLSSFLTDTNLIKNNI
jgi:hypothetical protein